jgi:hypothetical protein
MRLFPRCLLLVCLIVPGLALASPVLYYASGCSVVHQDAAVVSGFEAATIRVANELGYKLFAREDARGWMFKNKISGRILTVSAVGPDGEFTVTSETPVENDVKNAGLDAYKFSAAFVAQFPDGQFSRPMKVCGLGPGV